MPTLSLNRIEQTLRSFALSHPDATEDFPWGHRAIKVKGKIFVTMAVEEGMLHVSLKLPRSRDMAHDLPFATPTGYGLGKSGWITATFGKGNKPPLDLLKAWIEESYRAIAPKKLIAVLDGGAASARR